MLAFHSPSQHSMKRGLIQYMEQIKNQPDRAHPSMTVMVGKSGYRVNVHFNEQSRETLEDKLKRLLVMELGNKNRKNE